MKQVKGSVDITLEKTDTLRNAYDPTGIYLLKVNNRNTRKRCEISSKLTIKTLEQRQ